MSKHIVDQIINNYRTKKNFYIGEKVTISDHMIQTAMLAEKNHSSKSLICACLLHDYGHFVIKDPDLLVLKSLDGKHENVGFDFLMIISNRKLPSPSSYMFKLKDISVEINRIMIFCLILLKLV